jgi:hypothetical protein
MARGGGGFGGGVEGRREFLALLIVGNLSLSTIIKKSSASTSRIRERGRQGGGKGQILFKAEAVNEVDAERHRGRQGDRSSYGDRSAEKQLSAILRQKRPSLDH